MIKIECPSFSCTGETPYDETGELKLKDLECIVCGSKIDTKEQKDEKWLRLLSDNGYHSVEKGGKIVSHDWGDKREFDQKGHPEYEHCAYEQLGSETLK